MQELRVYLVDDNEEFRRSTAWMLEASGIAVRDFPSGPSLLQHFAGSAPPPGGCVVSDVRMPGMSGLELLEELRKSHSGLPVVFVTAHGDVPLAVEAMKRGAAHFIEKPFDADALIQAARIAASDPAAGRRKSPEAEEKLAQLTPRERQVLDLVTTGKFNKTIADQLGISIKTVELHRANLMGKLGVKNVQELVRLVLGYE
jgi:FixJ family two-component response regulator